MPETFVLRFSPRPTSRLDPPPTFPDPAAALVWVASRTATIGAFDTPTIECWRMVDGVLADCFWTLGVH